MITKFSAEAKAWQRGPGSYYAQVMKRFLLSGVLSELGKPNQIWISISFFHRDLYTGMPYYELTLYYVEHGMLVTYRGDLKESGNRLILCPYQGTTFLINQWWPEERESAESLVAYAAYPPLSKIPVEQAAGIDIAEFYELFKEQDSRACLETPAEMWK